MFYEYQHFGVSEYFCKEYGKNFNFPSHLHRSFELITVLSGNMTVTVDNRIYTVERGEAVLIFPNQLHSLQSEKCEHMLVIFSPDIVPAYQGKTKNKMPKESKITLDEYVLKEIDALNEQSSKIKMKSILYFVCAALDEKNEYVETKREDERLLYKIFDFVEQSYARECSLEALCQALGFSYYYVSRYFSNLVGMSFNSYVNRYRISKACYILNNSDCTVLECALECGFTSLRSFNRNFKIHTGVTPQEYRKNS